MCRVLRRGRLMMRPSPFCLVLAAGMKPPRQNENARLKKNRNAMRRKKTRHVNERNDSRRCFACASLARAQKKRRAARAQHTHTHTALLYV